MTIFRPFVRWALLGLVVATGAAGVAASARRPQQTPAGGKEPRFFEMRTYHAAPGKLDSLHARFRDHTNRLFQKHGMQLVGYWVPTEKEKGAETTLIYILAYPSREAREKSWAAFAADPEWKTAREASEVNGKLVERVEAVYLVGTDYSPIR